MPHVRRRRLSWREKADLWARWQRGESFRAIAEALGRVPDTLYRVVARSGGIPPPVRHRAARTLSTAERVSEISPSGHCH